ncbi:hypothetical protein PMAYCL1PPCAC_10227, partial [Pristionchus mayeri]
VNLVRVSEVLLLLVLQVHLHNHSYHHPGCSCIYCCQDCSFRGTRSDGAAASFDEHHCTGYRRVLI